jgi:hypothetical protein
MLVGLRRGGWSDDLSFHVDGSAVSSASSSRATSACSRATGTSPTSATCTHSERERGIDCQQRQDKYGKTDATHAWSPL